jgi:hypothetical protein
MRLGIRKSTAVLIGVFVVTLGVYVLVRPEPEPSLADFSAHDRCEHHFVNPAHDHDDQTSDVDDALDDDDVAPVDHDPAAIVGIDDFDDLDHNRTRSVDDLDGSGSRPDDSVGQRTSSWRVDPVVRS